VPVVVLLPCTQLAGLAMTCQKQGTDKKSCKLSASKLLDQKKGRKGKQARNSKLKRKFQKRKPSSTPSINEKREYPLLLGNIMSLP